MLYSGQEAGLNRRLKFFDRDTIDWGNFPLQDFYTRLFQLKKTHAALANGDSASQLRRLPGPADTYAFTRSKGGAAVLCAVNIAAEARTMPAHGWRVLVAEPVAG